MMGGAGILQMGALCTGLEKSHDATSG